jgi:hypothetical protein
MAVEPVYTLLVEVEAPGLLVRGVQAAAVLVPVVLDRRHQ